MSNLQSLDQYALIVLVVMGGVYIARVAAGLLLAVAARLTTTLAPAPAHRWLSSASARVSPRVTRGIAVAILGGGLVVTSAPAHASVISGSGSSAGVSAVSTSGTPAAPGAQVATARAAVASAGEAATAVVPDWDGSTRPALTVATLAPRGQATPPTPTPPATARPDASHAHHARQVTVRAGDSLWSLTATQLGPLHTDRDVARAWPILYRANRSVIGPDPSLILPGTVLTVPSALATVTPNGSPQ